MILAELKGAAAARPAVVALFGAGLIGQATLRALARRYEARQEHVPYDWLDDTSRTRQLDAIAGRLRAATREVDTIAIVWAAGRAGFMSDEAQIAHEMTSFRDVLTMTEQLTAALPRTRISLDLVSSAGALFEGQSYVTGRSTPSPRRPYGHLKLMQEESVRSSAAAFRRRIYRVTSVYGLIRPEYRAGLITTLIRDAIHRNVTRITGRMDTLRDFVFVDDVASFIAARLFNDGDRAVDYVLGTARPFSLLEVQHIVERAVVRKLYVSYSSAAENAESITFAPEVLPGGWSPTDLAGNIGIVYRDALSQQFFSGKSTTH